MTQLPLPLEPAADFTIQRLPSQIPSESRPGLGQHRPLGPENFGPHGRARQLLFRAASALYADERLLMSGLSVRELERAVSTFLKERYSGSVVKRGERGSSAAVSSTPPSGKGRRSRSRGNSKPRG